MKAVKINNKQIQTLLKLETIEELLDFCKNNNIPLKNAVQGLDYASKSMMLANLWIQKQSINY